MAIVHSMRTKQVEVTIDDDDVLRYVYHTPNTIESLKDAEENLGKFIEFVKSSGKSRYDSIVDLTNLKSVEYGVRKMYTDNETMNASRFNAIVAKNPVARMIGNFFMKVDRPRNPTKLFANQEKALTWIHEMRQKK